MFQKIDMPELLLGLEHEASGLQHHARELRPHASPFVAGQLMKQAVARPLFGPCRRLPKGIHDANPDIWDPMHSRGAVLGAHAACQTVTEALYAVDALLRRHSTAWLRRGQT